MENKNNRSFGTDGEQIAADYLTANNYKIISKNYRVGKFGEIDIVAREGGYVCFVEVKTRRSAIYGSPSEAVTRQKQNVIRKIAAIYLDRNRLNDANARFDVVEITFDKDQNHILNLIKNAF